MKPALCRRLSRKEKPSADHATTAVWGKTTKRTGSWAVAAPLRRASPVWIPAADDVANALWITSAVLGAATVTLLVLDLARKPDGAQQVQSLGVAVSPMRLSLTGSF